MERGEEERPVRTKDWLSLLLVLSQFDISRLVPVSPVPALNNSTPQDASLSRDMFPQSDKWAFLCPPFAETLSNLLKSNVFKIGLLKALGAVVESTSYIFVFQ